MANLTRLTLALASIGMIGGCAVGPDYQRPEAALPQQFEQRACGGTSFHRCNSTEDSRDPMRGPLRRAKSGVKNTAGTMFRPASSFGFGQIPLTFGGRFC